MLLTCFNGIFRAYWFPEGYLRTSSQKYTLQPRSSPLVHLTNDAVQKDDEDYGRYEKGNKVSYQSFAEYLSKTKNVDENVFQSTILPRMRQLALDAVRATFRNLDSKRMQHNFQLLGMDFMIDGDMKPYLIEINTNPCLELSSPLLATLIPALLEETFKQQNSYLDYASIRCFHLPRSGHLPEDLTFLTIHYPTCDMSCFSTRQQMELG